MAEAKPDQQVTYGTNPPPYPPLKTPLDVARSHADIAVALRQEGLVQAAAFHEQTAATIHGILAALYPFADFALAHDGPEGMGGPDDDGSRALLRLAPAYPLLQTRHFRTAREALSTLSVHPLTEADQVEQQQEQGVGPASDPPNNPLSDDAMEARRAEALRRLIDRELEAMEDERLRLKGFEAMGVRMEPSHD